MRVPIVEYPQIVRRNLAQFKQVFANWNQIKHFCENVTGLIAGDKITIQAINALFLYMSLAGTIQRSEVSSGIKQ